MDRYDEFKEVILSEIREAGNADEATHPVSYGYVLGLKMALSWAAVLREKEKEEDTKEESVDSRKKARWIDVRMGSSWNYQCSACCALGDVKSSFCRCCGAEMEEI